MLSLVSGGRHVAFLVDVESGSLSVSIVALRAGKPHMLASERAIIPPGERDETHIVAWISTHLQETSSRLLSTYEHNPDFSVYGPPTSVHVMLGMQFSRTRTARVTQQFPAETLVTDALIADLARKAGETPSELSKANILESSVIRAQLNGYRTGKPAGKRANFVSVVLFESDYLPTIKSAVEHVMQTLLPGRTLVFHSRTYVFLKALQELAPHERDFLVISVEGNHTDCIAVRKDELTDHLQAAEGNMTILAKLTGEKGLPEDIVTQLRMIATDTCSTPACEETKQKLAIIEPQLVKVFGETFAKLSTTRRLPNACLLLAAPELSLWLENLFTRIDFAQFTITTRPLSIIALNDTHLDAFVEWRHGTRDVNSGVFALFVNSETH